MPSRRRRTLPPVSAKVSAELRPLVAAIAEIIETGEGVRGDPLDRKLTLRDLLDSGIGRLHPGGLAGNPNALEPNPAPPNLATPPVPDSFNVSGGFDGRIDLTWTIPGSLYGNHAYTNVYRAEEDNFANAILVGREAGSFYTDSVRDDVTPKTYYYWISFTSTSDIEGPINATAGTPGAALVDPDYIIAQITGLIAESELSQSLNSRIDKIEANETAIVMEQTVRADADTALASDITTVQTSVDGNTAAIQTNATSVNGLSAQYTVKLDVNGAVAGFGLASTPSDDTVSGQFSEFYINADRFAILPQGGDTGLDARAPFIVQGGVVYLDTAVIDEASISEGHLGAITFGKLVASDGVTPITTVSGLLKADYIDADNLSVAEAATFYGDAQSGTFATGTAGWKFWQTGNLEAYNATIRGHIEADTGYIAGTLQIGGSASTLADVESDASGALSTANTANSTANTANTTANTANTTANAAKSKTDAWTRPGYTLIDGNKIFTGDAYVDTLQIKGQAVTFPQGSTAAAALAASDSTWTTLRSFSMSLTGAPIIIMASSSVYSTSSVNEGSSSSIRILKTGVEVLAPTVIARAAMIGTNPEFLNEYALFGAAAVVVHVQSPGSGAFTFTLQGKSGDHSNRSIVVLEAKR